MACIYFDAGNTQLIGEVDCAITSLKRFRIVANEIVGAAGLRPKPGEPPPVAELLSQRLCFPHVVEASQMLAQWPKRVAQFESNVDTLLQCRVVSGEPLKGCEGLLEVRDGFTVGRAACCLDVSLPKINSGFLSGLSAEELMGQRF